MKSSRLLQLAESLDLLINNDISGRGIIRPLYQAAREKAKMPVTLAAAEKLADAVHAGDVVCIATGWIDQPLVAPTFGETDGPPGAVALARSLRLSLKACPIILTDAALVDGMKAIAGAAGFHCVDPENLAYSVQYDKLLTLSVLPFPSDQSEAELAASQLLADQTPAACLAIERGGENASGIIHNMAGMPSGKTQARMDELFRQANEAGILTIGIGDGGNEIGMANIKEAIHAHVPYGDHCQCPCGLGIAPDTSVDLLVTAAISNWGAYAIGNLLAAITLTSEAITEPQQQADVIHAACRAGFHDAIYGAVAPSVDGCLLPVHTSLLTLLKEITEKNIALA